MNPLQTSFDALVSPEFLTQELSILFAILIITTLYAGLRLRSMFSFFGWMCMIVVLMLTLFTNLQLIWFWIAVVVEVFVLMLSMVEYTRVANS